MILGLLAILLLRVYYCKYHLSPSFVTAQRILLNLESFHTFDEVFNPVLPVYRLPLEQPMSIVNSTITVVWLLSTCMISTTKTIFTYKARCV
jgi:hypothetical protein